MKKLQELLEDEYEDFEFLDNGDKSSHTLRTRKWKSKYE